MKEWGLAIDAIKENLLFLSKDSKTTVIKLTDEQLEEIKNDIEDEQVFDIPF